jgi:hypothetical protein
MPTKDAGTTTNANANANANAIVRKSTDVEKSSSSSTDFAWGVFRQELGSYIIFSTILLPVAVALTALVFGGLLAAGEGWSYVDGFMYILRDVLDVNVELTTVTAEGTSGIVWDVFVSFWALGVVIVAFSFLYEMALCRRNTLGWAMEKLGLTIDEEYDEDGELVVTSKMLKHATAVLAMFVFLVVPILVGTLSVVLGGLLAAIEGWSFRDGALYLISELCNIEGGLVEVHPDTAFNKFFILIIDCWALAIFGSFVGLFVTAGVTKPWVQFELDVIRLGPMGAWRRIRWE